MACRRVDTFSGGRLPNRAYSSSGSYASSCPPVSYTHLDVYKRQLYYSKNVESFGTGLKRIADACDTAGCRYKFEVLKSGFVVVFYRTIEDEDDSCLLYTSVDMYKGQLLPRCEHELWLMQLSM